MKIRRLTEPIPPSHPAESPLVRVLLAEIKAQEFRDPSIVETALRQEEARAAGRLSVAERYLPPDIDDEIRAAFASGRVLKLVIGDWTPDAHFVPGLAGLTEQECRAYELELAGFRPTEIAAFMDRRRAFKFGRSLPVNAVDQYLHRAHRKLRRLFAVEDEAAAS